MLISMKLKYRQSLFKHNGFLAMLLSMVIVISGSLQLVHDQLQDHKHDSDCAMYVVDGNTPIATASSDCVALKQQVADQPYSPFNFVVSQFNHHAPRAPPFFSL